MFHYTTLVFIVLKSLKDIQASKSLGQNLETILLKRKGSYILKDIEWIISNYEIVEVEIKRRLVGLT
ncbi:hypothetical protein CUN85_12240 [Methanolobus halotolerans]|uniref:Uncharacterized protein n=1 Tax=Methanolobus halotolerans TaxID=2052935 RepID=A0A4E0QQ40_9EURY|nr:hypothetical protein CUN85_12240 [Methanolobus halotolerans]